MSKIPPGLVSAWLFPVVTRKQVNNCFSDIGVCVHENGCFLNGLCNAFINPPDFRWNVVVVLLLCKNWRVYSKIPYIPKITCSTETKKKHFHTVQNVCLMSVLDGWFRLHLLKGRSFCSCFTFILNDCVRSHSMSLGHSWFHMQLCGSVILKTNGFLQGGREFSLMYFLGKLPFIKKVTFLSLSMSSILCMKYRSHCQKRLFQGCQRKKTNLVDHAAHANKSETTTELKTLDTHRRWKI